MSYAQQDKFRWRFGLGVGNQYVKDMPVGADSALGNNIIEVNSNYLTYSAFLELSLSQDFGLKLYALTDPNEYQIANSGLLLSYYFDNDYILGDQAFIAPYFSAGLAFGTSQNSLSIPFGLGAKLRLSDRFNLNLDYTARTPTKDWNDADYNFGESLRAYASLSIHYNFGRKDHAYKAPIPYVSAHPETTTHASKVNKTTTLHNIDPLPVANRELFNPQPLEADTLIPIEQVVASDSSLYLYDKSDSSMRAEVLGQYGNILDVPKIKVDSTMVLPFASADSLNTSEENFSDTRVTAPKNRNTKAEQDSTLTELEYEIKRQKMQNELTALQQASNDSNLNYVLQENERLKSQLQANEKISQLEERIAQLEGSSTSGTTATSSATVSTNYPSGQDDYSNPPSSQSYNQRDYNANSSRNNGDNFGNAAAAGTGALLGSAIGSSGGKHNQKQIDRLESKIDSLQKQISKMQAVNSKAMATKVAVANDSTSSYTDSAVTTIDSSKADKLAGSTQTDSAQAISQKEFKQLQKQLTQTNKRVDSLLAYQRMQAAPAPLTVASELEKGEDKTFFANSGKVQVFFETNSFELDTRSMKKLDDMISYAKLNPETNFWVKGYTDQTGSARYNEMLSKKRASAVQEYLQINGIDQKRLNLVSLGQDNTVSGGSQAYGRRVEVVLY